MLPWIKVPKEGHDHQSSNVSVVMFFLSGRIPKLYASLQLPTAEASSVWGVFRLPWSPRQRSPSGWSLWREASPGLHPDQRKTGPIKGVPFIKGTYRRVYDTRDLIINWLFWAESCCRQAGEEKPGALETTRRKGEGGENAEEVSTDIRICADSFDVYIHC